MRKRKLPSTLRWLLALALVASACGHGHEAATPSLPPPTVPITSLPPDASSTTVPSPPTTRPATTTTTTATVPSLPPVALQPGDTGEDVEALQLELTKRGLFREEVDGVFGERTATAVIAFHKATDVERTALWSIADWMRLSGFTPDVPERDGETDRLEIDLSRQLLYLVTEDGLHIIPISSGNGALYENASGRLVKATTPRGDFSLYKHYEGWRISYLGGLYRPWYFKGGYAIHGSESVPAYPASHGCVRVPIWEADFLASELAIGLPVHVWN